MTGTLADLVGRLLPTLRTAGRFALAVRCGIVVAALLLVPVCGAADAGGNPVATLLGWLAVATCLATALQPDGVAGHAPPVLLGAWVLLVRPSVGWVVVLALLVWAIHLLSRWASFAPLHGRTGRDAVALLARDAAVELALVVAAGALVAAGVVLGRHLPGGAMWAVLLAVTLVASAWWAVWDARR